MTYKFVYDLPFVIDFSTNLLLPILFMVLILVVAILFYSYSHRNDKDPIYKYNVDLYSLLICIFLALIFFVIILGFANAFRVQMLETNLNTVICLLVLLAPLVPAIILILLIVRTIKHIKYKPQNERK